MITLVGEDIAKEGLSFLFYGMGEECKRCRLRIACIDALEKGRMYTIKEVKDTEHKCFLHNFGKVKVVDVEKAEIDCLMDSKKVFEGSTIHFESQDCPETCIFYKNCNPDGLVNGDSCKIVKDGGKHSNECPQGKNLTKVKLKLV